MPNFRAIEGRLKKPDGPYYGYGGQYGYASGSPFGRTRWSPLLPGAKKDWEGAAKDLDRNSVVAACLGWLQDNFVTARLQVGTQVDAKTFEPIDGHPLVALLGPRGRPNPDYSRRVFWASMILSWKVDGNAFAIKGRGAGGSGEPAAIWWEPHFNVTPYHEPGDPRQISYYYVARPEGLYRVDPEDILHVRDGTDKFNPMLGCSRLKSGIRAIVGYNDGETYVASIVGNMGLAGAVWMPNGDAVDPDVAIGVAGTLRRQSTGENAGSNVALTVDGHFERPGASPGEMGLDTLMDRPEATISALMGVNPMVIGMAVGATMRSYANQAEADRQAWNNGLIPMQDAFAEAIQSHLLPDFGDPGDLEVRWDRSAVTALADDADKKAERSGTLRAGGIITVNEARTMNGFDPIEGGDKTPVEEAREAAEQLAETRGNPEETTDE